jgi:hypothetical protein
VDDLARRIAKLSPQKRALLEIQLLKKKGIPEPIAIVGMGCRFPGAPNREAFWQLLLEGQDAITPIPGDRWDVDALYDEDAMAPGKTYCREGGFLDQVDQFDPTFFGIAPKEASYIDPQQRLFLEVVWAALEDAGIPRPSSSVARRLGSLWGCRPMTMASGCCRGPKRSEPIPRRAGLHHGGQSVVVLCSTCGDPVWRSIPPARLPWLPYI